MTARLFLLLLAALIVTPSQAADWPTYRGDAQRSGVAQEKLVFPLHEQWVYKPSAAPQPAWPDPGKELHRVDFDHAPQPIVAQGVVYFGSTTDDTLRALDAATGKLRWSFTTGGPIRFVPTWYDDKVYCPSDDGYLYCLAADDGKLLWKFHAAETEARVLGNGRMISRRPLRSGVLVDEGTAYVTAGMWPSEGILVHAVDAQSGSPRWCNDTADTMYLAQPHAAAYSLTGVAPQGYLLASRELLLVPTGRGVPAAFDRQTGELQYFRPSESKTHGGDWATLAGDRLYNGGLVYDLASGDQIACPERPKELWAAQAFDYGTRQNILGYRGRRILVDGQRVFGRREGHCLALAGDALLEGGDGVLRACDTNSKQEQETIWQASLEGQVRGIAVSDGRVFAATDRGTIHCYAAGEKPQPSVITDAREPRKENPAASSAADDATKSLLALLERERIDKGYALVVGDHDGRLTEALAARTSLHVFHLADDDHIVARRQLFAKLGLYGTRVAVQSLERLSAGDLPPYFANAVVVADIPKSLDGESLWRVLRPCGGMLGFLNGAPSEVERLLSKAEEPPAAKGTRGKLAWFRRGKLPGAFDWDSETPVETRVRWPLELSWFGGPGPDRMRDRHQTSVASPVVAAGRYFVSGERHVIAVDAYNGTELWDYRFAPDTAEPKDAAAVLTGLSADDDYAYLRIGEHWRRLDAQTGEAKGELAELPPGLATWGRVPRRADPFAFQLRRHALTGEQVPRLYYRAYGCNQVLASAGVDFFRSGTLGFYDLEDDSGLRNFGGMRPACSRSHNAALGMFLSSEGSSGCVCSYNFQTSLALAPSKHRSNEDWAIYYDLPTDGPVRQAAINLGAPGDRRDDRSRLWLGYPRPQLPIVFQLPFKIEVSDGKGLGPYRFDADRRVAGETDKPWIYASGYRGLRKLTVSLDEQSPLVSSPATAAVALDGRIGEREWPAEPQRTMHPQHDRQNRGAPNRPTINPERWKPELRVQHDIDNLYVAFRLANQVDRVGKPYAWIQRTGGRDVGVWSDDSYELFLSDGERRRVVHLGVSASGATYDALHTAGAEREDTSWNGEWKSSVAADDKAFVAELAIPWKTLADAGLSRERLTINAQTNWANWQMPLRFLGSRGRIACENFTSLGLSKSPQAKSREFRVRLHFAEPDGVNAGARRFSVRLQDREVLTDFDVAREAGGKNRAVVREFDDVAATDKLTVEFVPLSPILESKSETILSGLELEEVD